MHRLAGVRAAMALNEATMLGILRRAPAEAVQARGASGAWSARENLAHLGRYQEVLVGRLARIAAEETPLLGRYRSEEDAASAPWLALAPQPLADALAEARRVLVRCLDGMPAEALARRARHPLFGEMDVPAWLALFLNHEGHHLYVARLRLGEALSRAGGAPAR